MPTRTGIPVVTVNYASRRGAWTGMPARYWEAGRALVKAFDREAERYVPRLAWWAAQRALGGLNSLYGSHFGLDADALADSLGVTRGAVITANAAYELAHLGCTTFAVPTPSGPLHARNLDWEFPGKHLRRHVVVLRVRGTRAGDYLSVTWPGLFGVLTAVAPGRFSATINYVVHDDDSTPAALVRRLLGGHWPATWALRLAMDEQPDFASAVRFLERVRLISPVLFTVAGTRNGERVVIERGAASRGVRRPASPAAPVSVTNHYTSTALRGHNADLSDMDTEHRLRALREGLDASTPREASAALRLLSGPDFLYDGTQHQVVMNARSGRLVLRVPGRGRALTVEL